MTEDRGAVGCGKAANLMGWRPKRRQLSERLEPVSRLDRQKRVRVDWKAGYVGKRWQSGTEGD